MSITLPKLPEPAGFRTRYRSEPGMIGHYPWTYADQRKRRAGDRPEHETEDLYTADQLRARDLEVVRIVLEAAAQAAQPDDSYQDRWFYAKADAVKCIRALEVRHE